MYDVQSMHLIMINSIKLAHLMRGYISSVDSANYYGVFSFARMILEQNATLQYVNNEIRTTVDSALDWESKAAKCIKLLTRARLGTGDREILGKSTSAGISMENLKPINISVAMNRCEELFPGCFAGDYDMFSDNIHHNLSSTTACSTGFTQGTQGNFGKRIILRPSGCQFTRYVYIEGNKGGVAFSKTVERVDYHSKGLYRLLWKGELIESPFTKEFLLEESSRRNQEVKIPPKPNILEGKIGRNSICPCGSGIKHKKCCGR